MLSLPNRITISLRRQIQFACLWIVEEYKR